MAGTKSPDARHRGASFRSKTESGAVIGQRDGGDDEAGAKGWHRPRWDTPAAELPGRSLWEGEMGLGGVPSAWGGTAAYGGDTQRRGGLSLCP